MPDIHHEFHHGKENHHVGVSEEDFLKRVSTCLYIGHFVLTQ